MSRVLRARKDGGFSYCSSPEEKVGFGRCVHISGVSFKMSRSPEGVNFVEIDKISEELSEPIEMKAELDKVESYMKDLNEKLSKEKIDKIINFFKNNNM